MAQRIQTLIVSDLSGDDLGEAGQTVRFGYQGVDYEIDLSAKEVAGFDKAIAMYVEHARRVGGRRQSGTSKSNGSGKSELDAIRKWARDAGHQVSDRGRISQKVKDAYSASH